VPVRTLKQASAWVDKVGIALVFPKDDLVLPSLWEAAGGLDEYAKRDGEGKFVEWTKPMAFVWGAKDELPAGRLACAGKHIRGRSSLVALDVLPALVAARPAEPELSPVEGAVLEAVRAAGVTSTRDLPELARHEKKRVQAAVVRLQRLLLLTNAGLEEDLDGWPAILVDLVDRRYARLVRRPPAPDEARVLLVRRLLATAGELSAVDVTGVFGWRKRDAVEALEATEAPSRTDGGITLWTARATRPRKRGRDD
jgi:hypothetical protein